VDGSRRMPVRTNLAMYRNQISQFKVQQKVPHADPGTARGAGLHRRVQCGKAPLLNENIQPQCKAAKISWRGMGSDRASHRGSDIECLAAAISDPAIPEFSIHRAARYSAASEGQACRARNFGPAWPEQRDRHRQFRHRTRRAARWGDALFTAHYYGRGYLADMRPYNTRSAPCLRVAELSDWNSRVATPARPIGVFMKPCRQHTGLPSKRTRLGTPRPMAHVVTGTSGVLHASVARA